MNAHNAILVTREPRSSRWELPASATGHLVMVGWHLVERPIDGGMPPVVARLLVRGLTRSFWVSYFDALEPASSTPAHVGRLVVSGLRARLGAMAQRLPGTVFQVSTRAPATAERAFDASLFSWPMLGQVLLLSAVERSPRTLSWAEMWFLTERSAVIAAADLTALDIQAALFPGVDGDVAAIVSSTGEVEAKILADVHSEAEAAGFCWRVLSENEFAQAM